MAALAPLLTGFALVLPGFALALPGVGPASVLAQTPGGAEWATLAQEVEVDMSAGDGSADVLVRYRLGPGEEGAPLPSAEPITFDLLGFDEATAGEIVLLRPDGGERPEGAEDADGPSGSQARPGERVVLWPTVGSHRMAVVEPPFDLDGETLTMTVAYRVQNVAAGLGAGAAGPTTAADGRDAPAGRDGGGGDLAGMIHARIPVLTGPPVRAESGGEAFQARLTVPESWAVSEGFPSGLRAVDDGVWAVSLTVAPSVVGFRASTDGRWRPGLPLLVDVLTVLILASFIGAGWRHLRSIAR